MNLYQIGNDYQKAFDDMQEMNLDAETIEDSLAAIKGEFEDKAINCIKWEKTIEGRLSAIDTEIKRLQDLKKSVSNQRDSFREYIRSSMEATDINKIECDLFTITLRKAMDVVEIVDSELVPNEFKVEMTTVKIDKKSLKRALKLGSVEGAKMSNGKRGLVIK